MTSTPHALPDEGFLAALLGDGRAFFKLVALALIGAGAFVLFQAATGHFLPHDTEFLGMDAPALCSLHGCRIVHFMIHDRISFGGVLLAIGVMYLWLSEFPLRRRESWAWWAFAISGGAGFLSFLAYLGYGYLDTWHGAATLVLAPLFILGLLRTRALREHRVKPEKFKLRSGRALLLASTLGIVAAGLTITTLGMTMVFVPQDLEFMDVTVEQLRALNVRLVPLIAHDRAGFGGALISCGLAMFIAVLYGRMSRSLWQALTIAGLCGFVTAIGVHAVIGYNSVTHVAPAVAGAIVFFIGIAMTAPRRVTA
jgi:MFS family permease